MADYNTPHKKTAGEVLKENRESKGLSLTTVHETTKIPLDVLKAIEEGYSVRTLSPFYLKGFVKMYAEYLGVDSSKVFDRSTPVIQKAEKPAEPKITQIKKKEYRIPEDDFDLNRLFSKERQRMVVKIIGGLFILFLIVRMIGCLVPKKEKKQAEAIKNPVVLSPRKIAEEKLVAPVAVKKPVPVKKEQSVAQSQTEEKVEKPKAEVNDKVHLTIKALKGGWLQVKVDGTVVMESTVKAGAVESWEANKEIVISGRMIHNLEFELNGKMIGTLGRQDNNARRVVITKKGLAVR